MYTIALNTQHRTKIQEIVNNANATTTYGASRFARKLIYRKICCLKMIIKESRGDLLERARCGWLIELLQCLVETKL